MYVELDVFSGRPNPRMELDEHSSRMLLQLQNLLKTTSGPPPDPPGLGYRGFLYSDATGCVRVYRGYVKTPRGTFADPAFSVEQFLLERVPAEYAGLCQKIASELANTK